MADETEAAAGTETEVDNQAEAPDAAENVAANETEGNAAGSMLSDEDVESLLSQAQEAQQEMGGAAGEASESLDGQNETARPMPLTDLTPGGEPVTHGFDLLQDVQLEVKIELGRCEMFVDEVLGLSEGAVVQLEKLAGDPVDILVNGKLVARGEVLVLNDNFCVRVGEILTPESE